MIKTSETLAAADLQPLDELSKRELLHKKFALKIYLESEARKNPIPPKFVFEKMLSGFLGVNGLTEKARDFLPLLNLVDYDVVLCECCRSKDNSSTILRIKNLAGKILSEEILYHPNDRFNQFHFYAAKILTTDRIETIASMDGNSSQTEDRDMVHFILYDSEE